MHTHFIDEHHFHDSLISGVFIASNVYAFSSDIYFDINHILKWATVRRMKGNPFSIGLMVGWNEYVRHVVHQQVNYLTK